MVQNQLNQVAVFKLNRRGTEGRLVGDPLTSERFDVPTTVAAYNGSLYLPNARFPPYATPGGRPILGSLGSTANADGFLLFALGTA